ncbi:hypothetical protein IP88_04365 [alpha proteobacterium AAP81b]|nr:hypothetical protein IP88_04365 [alpha proteobacterium AAP81b]
MMRRVVTALAGRALARNLGGRAAGPIGTAAGFLVPMALPRLAAALGPWGMIGAAAGAWAVKRAMTPKPAPKLTERKPIVTPPPIPMAMPYDGF